jgi:hypothetical protein
LTCVPSQPFRLCLSNLTSDSRLLNSLAAFKSTCDSRRRPILGLARCANLRLSPPINLPGVLSGRLSDLRRLLTFQLRLGINPRLASAFNSSALPWNPTSDLHRMSYPQAAAKSQLVTFVADRPFGSAFELNLRLTARHQLKRTLGAPSLWTQVQI